MIEIIANFIEIYKMSDIPHILVSWVEGDEECEKIKNFAKKIELDFYREVGIKIIKVEWNDLSTEYSLPAYINHHTVFYLRYGYTVGTIYKPNFQILNKFILKCDEVSLQLRNPFGNQKIFSPINDPQNVFRIQIISPQCQIYQFHNKLKPIYSK